MDRSFKNLFFVCIATISFAGAILFISNVYAAIFIDDTQPEFDVGTYSNTAWDTDHAGLSLGQTSGNFTSKVFDAGAEAKWNQITWSENLVSADKLIAADNSADVWKSLDNAGTWSLVKDDYNSTDGNGVSDMAADGLGNLFILKNQDVWKSTDQGATWTKINDDYNGSESQNGLRIACDSSNNLYIAEGDEDIWMSADGGATWTKKAANINESADNNINGFVAVGSSLYAVDTAADVWKSDDSGITWTKVNDNYNETDGNGIDYMTYDQDLNLYIVYNQDVWKSTDQGLSWTKVNDNYNGSEINDATVIVANSTGQLFIAEGDEDIWTSADGGATWTKQATNINGTNGNIFGMVHVPVSTDIVFQFVQAMTIRP